MADYGEYGDFEDFDWAMEELAEELEAASQQTDSRQESDPSKPVPSPAVRRITPSNNHSAAFPDN